MTISKHALQSSQSNSVNITNSKYSTKRIWIPLISWTSKDRADVNKAFKSRSIHTLAIAKHTPSSVICTRVPSGEVIGRLNSPGVRPVRGGAVISSVTCTKCHDRVAEPGKRKQEVRWHRCTGSSGAQGEMNARRWLKTCWRTVPRCISMSWCHSSYREERKSIIRRKMLMLLICLRRLNGGLIGFHLGKNKRI